MVSLFGPVSSSPRPSFCLLAAVFVVFVALTLSPVMECKSVPDVESLSSSSTEVEEEDVLAPEREKRSYYYDDDDYSDEYSDEYDGDGYDDDGDDYYGDDYYGDENENENDVPLSALVQSQYKPKPQRGNRRHGGKGRSLLGGVGGLLGGLLGTGGNKRIAAAKAPTQEPLPVVQNADVSQKALAGALMQAAQVEKDKLLARLPKGTKLEDPPTPAGGLSVKDLEPGTLAMLDDGDMVHRFPATHQGPQQYAYLPKSGGVVLMTHTQIAIAFGEVTTVIETPATYVQHNGLLPEVGNLLGGLLFGGNRGRGMNRKGKGHNKRKRKHRNRKHGDSDDDRRKRREIRSSETITIQVQGQDYGWDETKQERMRKRRGWLLGNGSQKGNGCHGVFGIVGWIMGNKKGCNESDDSVTIIGANGGTIMPPGTYAPGTEPQPEYPSAGYPQGGYPPPEGAYAPPPT